MIYVYVYIFVWMCVYTNKSILRSNIICYTKRCELKVFEGILEG